MQVRGQEARPVLIAHNPELTHVSFPRLEVLNTGLWVQRNQKHGQKWHLTFTLSPTEVDIPPKRQVVQTPPVTCWKTSALGFLVFFVSWMAFAKVVPTCKNKEEVRLRKLELMSLLSSKQGLAGQFFVIRCNPGLGEAGLQAGASGMDALNLWGSPGCGSKSGNPRMEPWEMETWAKTCAPLVA